MPDLHDLLEREGRRVSLSSGAADRMFERRHRRNRRRRIAAAGVGMLLLAAVIATLRAIVPGPQRAPMPATPPLSPASLAGTYTLRLPDRGITVGRHHMGGTYTMQVTARGSISLVAPFGFDMSAAPITYSIHGQDIVTNLLVGSGCSAPGRYHVTLGSRSVRFEPVDDQCGIRTALLGSRSWTKAAPPPPSDALQGDWSATFSCGQMVRTVRGAPVSSTDEAAWRSAVVRERHTRLREPCSGGPNLFVNMFRFDRGRLQIFGGTEMKEGFDGLYRVDGDTLVIWDPLTRNIEGKYRARFLIRSGALSFTLLGRAAADPFFVATWEPSPFVRA